MEPTTEVVGFVFWETPSLKLRTNDQIELHIDRLSVGGRGVGRYDGVVVFVPNAAPDERLRVRLTHVKKNFAEAEIVEILSPSPHRVTPPCPVAGVCGGCTWQQVEYGEQLRQKRELVRESLRKFSGFDVSAEGSVQPVVASPKTFRYRNRVQFHHSKGHLGFYKRGSHQLVDIDDCPITEEAIAAEIPKLKKSIHPKSEGRFEMLMTRDGRIARRDVTTVDDENGGLAFSQVNTAQNEVLVEAVVQKVVSILGPNFTGVFFDLYCGDGNFTFPLATSLPQAKFVGIELSRDAIERARERTATKALDSRMKWHVQDVGTYLTTNTVAANSAILLDPPRVGCSSEVVDAISKSNVRNVFYVSCHPVTLGRDLKPFKDAGFRLLEVRPFDMFPQTDHVETLVVLERA